MRSLLAVLWIFSLTIAASAQYFERITEGSPVTDGGDSRSVNWIDYDNDHDLDLFVTNGPSGGANNFLYRNDGGVFARITGDPIVVDGSSSDGSTWGDFDNDGDLDGFVANWYNQNNLLYRNNGSGGFTLESTSPVATDHGYSESGSWADYDSDGWLDLVVANSAGNPLRNFVYHNNGDGTFTRVTDGVIATTGASSRVPLWADTDNDGDLDLVITSEANENELYFRNDGAGSFTRITEGALVSSAGYTASGSWGDYDNDGDLDLVLANFGPSGTNCAGAERLFRNEGDGTFTRIDDTEISAAGGCSFGSLWADLDNDADLDLVITNGFRSAGNVNFLFWNQGGGSFARETSDIVATDSGWCYGIAAADYDRDGDLDLFAADWTPVHNNNRLYRNLAHAGSNHWLGLNLIGTTSNRSAIGARVRVKATINGQPVWQLREVAGQTGYCGQTLEQHFGLADAATVDSLWIRWPSGLVEIYTGIAANQYLTVTEGSGWVGTERARPALPKKHSLLHGYPNPFNPRVEIEFELAATEPVELTILDLHGRAVTTLLHQSLSAGLHRVPWNGLNRGGQAVASGVYFCRLQAGTFHTTLKLLKLG